MLSPVEVWLGWKRPDAAFPFTQTAFIDSVWVICCLDRTCLLRVIHPACERGIAKNVYWSFDKNVLILKWYQTTVLTWTLQRLMYISAGSLSMDKRLVDIVWFYIMWINKPGGGLRCFYFIIITQMDHSKTAELIFTWYIWLWWFDSSAWKTTELQRCLCLPLVVIDLISPLNLPGWTCPPVVPTERKNKVEIN